MPLIKNLIGIRNLSWPMGGAVLVLLYLWGMTIWHLSVAWSNNPQYSYGWAVPFLCVYLIGRIFFKPGARSQESGAGGKEPGATSFQLLFGLLACLLLPLRLIQEANPDWSLVGWGFALLSVAFTLFLLQAFWGGGRGREFAFPVAFFLVAVPWPTVFEGPLIQNLTRLDVGATCELAGWLGIPAMPHGNVIEVATGVVGIDEACSGIRSFQATLMISLFLGEWLHLAWGRRVMLVLTGFALALLFNFGRTTLLVWVAASKGIPAIAHWHDPAGIIILLGCFFGLWTAGHWLARKNHLPEVGSSRLEAGGQKSDFCCASSAVRRLVFALAAWILLVEAGVKGWYAWRESQSSPNPSWQVVWPTNAPAYTTIPFPEATHKLLRFDAGMHAAWEAEDGRRLEVFYLRWNPGRTAGYLAKLHTPQACLPAAGMDLVAGPERIILSAGNITFPFQCYAFEARHRRVDVFYCHWPDRGEPGRSLVGQSSWADRFRNVWEGRGNSGQRVLEIVLWDYPDAALAQTDVQQLLVKIISPFIERASKQGQSRHWS